MTWFFLPRDYTPSTQIKSVFMKFLKGGVGMVAGWTIIIQETGGGARVGRFFLKIPPFGFFCFFLVFFFPLFSFINPFIISLVLNMILFFCRGGGVFRFHLKNLKKKGGPHFFFLNFILGGFFIFWGGDPTLKFFKNKTREKQGLYSFFQANMGVKKPMLC